MSISDTANPARHRPAGEPGSPTMAMVGSSGVHEQGVKEGVGDERGEQIVGAGGLGRRWRDAMVDLLERAEARIAANFRVPPGGG
ncbi:hypothetical protein [Pseudacidovorax intermedius]|uniref:hypothetical protein n=1 Tax=Pseudacidovorax intermedius TaxID=433924 RepID=UPI0011C07587|nr:hypothetical protein [Pseudacidovorax intermedius]